MKLGAHIHRMAIGALLAGVFSACASLEQIDRTLYELVPTNPVTGAPVASVVSEAEEVQRGASFHARIVAGAQQHGLALHPPGAHLDQMIRVLEQLGPVATAHRPRLPWQYWLVPDPGVNAFTPGGGYVYVLDGLWGRSGLIREGGDDELVFVLAHEMAHVNLLHGSLRVTQQRFSDRMRDDPFYAASFTAEQEAEADRLAVLYASLAGYDPEAGARIWERTGTTEADQGYLNTHPVGLNRAAGIRTAMASIAGYRFPGQVNPDWQQRLARNPLFPRVSNGNAAEPSVGSGLARAIQLGLETKMEHDAAKREAERREEAAARLPQNQVPRVKVLAVQSAVAPNGVPVIQMQIQNGAIYDVVALGVRVVYLNGATTLAQDPNCGGPAQIPAGQTVWLACTRHAVQGATQYRVELTDVRFR